MSAVTSRPKTTAWLDQVPSYVPGAPIAEGGLALASNEAYACSPDVQKALSAGTTWNRYPDPLANRLREALARKHQVSPSQILVGNGSDELVQLLVAAFVGRGGTVVAADPPYAMSRISTLVAGGKFVGVPLIDWAHDLDGMASAKAEMAYVVNPHNPTGTAHSRTALEAFARTAAANLLVIDEAYIDFAADPEGTEAIPLVANGKTVVLRTFSKAYGLAAFRVGYLIASEHIVQQLRRVRAPFSVTTPAQLAAEAALGDTGFLRDHVSSVREVRTRLTAALRVLGLQVPESHANFVLAIGVDEQRVVGQLTDQGVSVRAGSGLGVPGSIRITIPRLDQLDRLISAIVRTRSPRNGRPGSCTQVSELH